MDQHMFFGGEAIRDEIIRLVKQRQCAFQHLVHEETPTSADSARIRGTLLEEGIKSLILKGKTTKKNYQFNLPSHLKLDMKSVQELTGEKSEFEDQAVIFERFGLIIGGVPPFGNLMNLETYFDEKIKALKQVAFNCGLRTESVIMDGADLIALVQPKFASFSK